MKKNILLIVAIALVGTVTLTLDSLRAQNGPPGEPPSGQTPPPNMRPSGPPRGRPPGGSYRQAIGVLKRVKADLERSKEDFDGHRQSAMDACDKAIQELEAVQSSVEAARAAAAAAAKAAAQQTNAPAPAAAPAPNQ
jgi:hypothetical protein